MKSLLYNKLYLIFLLFLFVPHLINAQSEDFAIANKSNCVTLVTAYCSNSTSLSSSLLSQDARYSSCPTGSYLCYVKVEFPSTTVMISYNIGQPCLNPGNNIPIDPCFDGQTEWGLGANQEITFNFY